MLKFDYVDIISVVYVLLSNSISFSLCLLFVVYSVSVMGLGVYLCFSVFFIYIIFEIVLKM